MATSAILSHAQTEAWPNEHACVCHLVVCLGFASRSQGGIGTADALPFTTLTHGRLKTVAMRPQSHGNTYAGFCGS